MSSTKRCGYRFNLAGRTAFVHEGTDDEFKVVGYIRNRCYTALYIFLSIFSVGFGFLFGYWFPIKRLKFTHDRCELEYSTAILIKQTVGKRYFVSYIKKSTIDLSAIQNSSYTTYFEKESFRQTEIKYFEHMFFRYFFSEKCDTINSIWGSESTWTFEQFFKAKNGLNSNYRSWKLKIYDKNYINVPVKPYWLIFLKLSLNPFYIFQLFSVILWMNDDYVLYACLILMMTVISLCLNTYETKKNIQKLHDMIGKCSDSKVLESNNGDKEVITKSSKDLVPGDILIIPLTGMELPCDVVLLSGRCVVNESSLTGESIPTVKTAIDRSKSSKELYEPSLHKQHTLFNGTQIKQGRLDGENKYIAAIVIRTGFYTLKGSLIRSIIFPKPIQFTFFRDSMKFILCLAVIAVIGFIYTVYIFTIHGVETYMIAKRALDLFTIVIPPALPATISAGVLYALHRLRKENIHCIDPDRINVCGKIKLVVFDKTGTLTEDHLEVSGVAQTKDGIVSELQTIPNELADTKILKAMASCHSLTMIDDEITGDPIDLYMFTFTGWKLIEPDSQNSNEIVSYTGKFSKHIKALVTTPEKVNDYSKDGYMNLESNYIAILKYFTFDSALQRMSVVCQIENDDSLFIFTKGSPEKVISMCTEQSVPNTIEVQLQQFTQVGHRVLAFGYKKLNGNQEWEDIKKLTREEAEIDLEFLGFIVFENVIKENTHATVDILTKASIRSIMATGDNLFTASYVARQLHMVKPHQSLIELKIHNNIEQYNRLEGPAEEIKGADETKVAMRDLNSFDPSASLNYAIVISGACYENVRKNNQPLLKKLLVSCAVFARMSPDQKAMLIEDLKDIGYGVCMCGDGANDCGALKAAHAGIALSLTEASVAAPFTSKKFDITCIPHLIKEGRAALTTAFATFKYMALYSFIQFCGMLILYYIRSNYSNNQFLYADLFLNLPLVFTMTLSCASKSIALKRPLGRLAHPIFLGSIICQVILMIAVQFIGFYIVQSMPWYQNSSAFPIIGDMEYLSYENTVVLVISFFQYIWLSLACLKGKPYRAPIYYNYKYATVFLITFACTLYLSIKPTKVMRDLVNFVVIPSNTFTALLLAIVFVNLCLALLLERFFDSQIAKRLSDFIRRKKGPRNAYKHILKKVYQDKNWPPIN